MSGSGSNFIIVARLLAGLLLCAAFDLPAADRVFRCVGAHGELVFGDQPCSRTGLSDAGVPRETVVHRALRGNGEDPGCGFQSHALTIDEPGLEEAGLKLAVEIDEEGPYLMIEASGQYLLGPEGLKNASFDSRLTSQGLQLGDGKFVEADWRMGDRTLGFGRSRMRSVLGALSQQQGSLVVWFEGLDLPLSVPTMPAESFRLALDNARRCWKTRAIGTGASVSGPSATAPVAPAG